MSERCKTTEERLENIEIQLLGQKKVLTFDETAQYTGLSKSYLYKLTSGKKIPHFKPTGKMCYFNREDLEKWLQQNRVSTSEEIDNEAQIRCMRK